MGLATPVAIMAGTNAAARRGILIRDGVALERAGRLTAVIFDKTGTLTQGKPVVERKKAYVPEGAQPALPEIKLAARSREIRIIPSARRWQSFIGDDFPFTEWQEVRGSGVQAKLRQDNFQSTPLTVRLGSLRWLGESGVDLGQLFEKPNGRKKALRLLGLAADHSLLGMLAVQDTLKPGVREVMQQLQSAGAQGLSGHRRQSVDGAGIAKRSGHPVRKCFCGGAARAKIAIH
jgi:Cu+-exporting ATPase